MKNDKEIKDLLSVCPVHEWKDWLFNLQSVLIDNGHVGMLNESGRGDFAGRMLALHHFFTQVETSSQNR